MRLPRFPIGFREAGGHVEIEMFARLGIHEPHFSQHVDIPLARREYLDDEHVVSERREHLEPRLEPGGIEKVGDHDCHATTKGTAGKLSNALPEVGAPACFERLEHREHREDAASAASGRNLAGQRRAERQNGHAIEVDESDVAERRGQSSRLIEFGVGGHRTARIEKQVDRQVLFLIEQSEQQPVQTFVGFPIDVAHIVAGRVLAVVGKLEPAPALPRLPVGTVASCERAHRDDAEVFEFLEKVSVEHGKIGHVGHVGGVGHAEDRSDGDHALLHAYNPYISTCSPL